MLEAWKSFNVRFVRSESFLRIFSAQTTFYLLFQGRVGFIFASLFCFFLVDTESCTKFLINLYIRALELA